MGVKKHLRQLNFATALKQHQLVEQQFADLQRFRASPERAQQLDLLRRLSTGKDFGLSPEEAGRIQEEGRLAQEAAFRQGREQIGSLFSRGSITSGQRQSLLRNALAQRGAGLADFQRREILRKLQEARTRPLFQVQAIEALANAMTGTPNLNQMLALQQLSNQTQALGIQAATKFKKNGGGAGGILGGAAGGAATGFKYGGGLWGALGGALIGGTAGAF